MRIVIPVLTRLLSALCALALMVLGGLTVVEVVSNWTGNGFVVVADDLPTRMRSTTWDAQVVRTSLVVAVAAGLALVLTACWRRPPLTVKSRQAGVEIERRSLERTLGRNLDALDGVSGSRVRADRRRIRATVETSRRLPSEAIAGRVSESLASFCALHELDLTPVVSLRAERAER
jgi:hypothetical protein